MGSHCQVVVNPSSEMEHNNELNEQSSGSLLGRPVGDEFILAGATQVVMWYTALEGEYMNWTSMMLWM